MPLRFKRTKGTYHPGSRTSTTTRTRGGTWSKTVTSSTPSSTTGRIPYATIEGASETHAGTAILLATILFIFAEWKPVVAGILNEAIPGLSWTQAVNAPKPNYRMLLGGIVFIAIIGIIAASSPTGSSIMIWMLIAMWLLFMMFNGSGTMSSVFGWLQGKASSSTSTSSGTPTANQTNTNTNTSSNTTH